MIAIPTLLFAAILAAGACDDSLKQAATAIQHSDAVKARSILDSVRSNCSQSSNFNELEGVVNELSGKPAEAEAAFRKAVSLNPESARLWSDLGLSYLKSRNIQDAARALRQALKLDPSDERAAKYALGIYVQLGDWQQAQAVTGQINATTKADLLRDPAFFLWVAQTLLEAKQTTQLDDLLAANTQHLSPPLLFSLGTLFAQHQRYEKAVDYLKRIPPASADDAVYFNLGLAYSHLKQFRRARESYYNAIDKDATKPEVYFRVGLDFATLGQVRTAVPWLFRARELGPGRADVAYALCEQLLVLKYVTTAGDVINSALKMKPGDVLLTVAAGDVAQANNDAPAAVAMYTQALKREPKSVPALVGLARTAQRGGKDDEAAKYLKTALSIEVNDPASNRQMGIIEARRGEWTAALSHFKRAWAVDQSNPDVGLELARAFRHTNRPSEGLTVLNIVRPALRNSTEFHFELAQLYAQLHRQKEAQAERDAVQALRAAASDVLPFESPKTYVY